MSSLTVEIDARYNGPPGSGNGGYACGTLGTLIGGCAEVTLKQPPPLDTPMTVQRDGDQWQMLSGDQLVATGKPSELELEIPAPPAFDEAQSAEQHYSGLDRHIFPTCFVCGPDRGVHDGLRLFTGPLDGREVVASHWLPGNDVAGADPGEVDARVVWSALDCPTFFGGQQAGYPDLAVLGRLTVKQLAAIELDMPHVVIGWPIDAQERKWNGGSAIFTADGELRAFSRGTWVVIPADHAGFAVRT